MERRWKMSVAVSLKRLQQLVPAILVVYLSRQKVLIEGADLQANDAVIVSIEDWLLFAGSSGVDAVERRCESSN